MQWPLQFLSWGHTIEVTADKGLLLNKISPASRSLPSKNRFVTWGIGVETGHPLAQDGTLHFRQRCASDFKVDMSKTRLFFECFYGFLVRLVHLENLVKSRYFEYFVHVGLHGGHNDLAACFLQVFSLGQ
jgi:hypothetical protein